jgi:hypothetical protein
MVSIRIDVNKKDFIWIIPLVTILVIGISYAYATFEPSAMGHSPGELELGLINVLEGVDTIVIGEMSRSTIPKGTLDVIGDIHASGDICTDDKCLSEVAETKKACTFCLSCGGSWPTSSGRIYSYYAPTNAYSSNCAGTYPAANRWVYLCCK